MCLAIYKPSGMRIKKKYLRNGFESNDDGAGFAVCIKGKLEVHKGLFTFDAFWDAYEPYQDAQCAVHFRWATHGKCTKENCHPFEICGGKYAVIHNGILPIDTTNNSERSDTWHFATRVLAPMLKQSPPETPSLRYLVECTIGDHNKIVILSASGVATIYNEKAGHWYKGAWYSNDAYKTPRYSGGCYGMLGLSGTIAKASGAVARAWRGQETEEEWSAYTSDVDEPLDYSTSAAEDQFDEMMNRDEMERRNDVNEYLKRHGKGER